jgi:hypothetical protein
MPDTKKVGIQDVDVLIFDNQAYKNKEVFNSIKKDLLNQGFELDLDNIETRYGKLDKNRYNLKDENGEFFTEKTGEIELVVIPYFYNLISLATFKSDRDRLICTKEEKHKVEKTDSKKELANRIKVLNRKLRMMFMGDNGSKILKLNEFKDVDIDKILKYNTQIYFYPDKLNEGLFKELKEEIERSFYENIT